MAAPGHHSTYWITLDIEGQPKVSYELTVPRRGNPSTDPGPAPLSLPEVCLSRHGGPNARDAAFRAELYGLIGSIAVAAGQAEAAMKRVLLVMSESVGNFESVDLTWSDLVKRLRKESRKTSHRAEALREILAWAERENVKKRRDDVIHACWLDYADIGVQRARFERKSEGYSLLGSFAGLEADRDVILDFADRLNALVYSDWPQGRLPADGHRPIPSAFGGESTTRR